MAHEINNPLAYVSNNLAVLERDVRFLLTLLAIYEKAGEGLAATQPELVRQAGRLASEFDLNYVKDNMGKILRSTRQGVKRVADIVQNLRGFARLDQAAVDQADIHEALEDGRRDAARPPGPAPHHRRRTSRQVAPGGRLGRAAQSGLLESAGQRHAGDRVDPSRRRPDRHHHRRHDDGEIVVEVADNGCGIADEILPQIFDPFFTTKDVGDGTGLGLSITHSIVQDHGGRLEVESVPGLGTRFRVFLPVARKRSQMYSWNKPASADIVNWRNAKGDGDAAYEARAASGSRHDKAAKGRHVPVPRSPCWQWPRSGRPARKCRRAHRGRARRPGPASAAARFASLPGIRRARCPHGAWRKSAACKLLTETKLGAFIEDLVLQGIELAQDAVPREKRARGPEVIGLLKHIASNGFGLGIATKGREDWRVAIVIRRGDRPEIKKLLEGIDAAGAPTATTTRRTRPDRESRAHYFTNWAKSASGWSRTAT